MIRHPDDIEGMLPLPHVKTLVVKAYGDYVDTRLRNTPRELAEYDPRMRKLIERIAQDFGLITAGWSATHDAALRDAIGSSPTRSFTVFWSHVGALSAEADALARSLRAQPIRVESADVLFESILDSVEAIERLTGGAPFTAKMAAATAKRLSELPPPHIRLHDLLNREARAARATIVSADYPLAGPFDAKEFMRRVNNFETASAPTLGALSTTARWAADEDTRAITSTIQTLSDVPLGNGNTGYPGVSRYPALLALYVAGVIAVREKRWGLVRAIFSATVGDSDSSRGRSPAVLELTPHQIFVDGTDKVLAPQQHTPASLRIEAAIGPHVIDVFANQDEFLESFDAFELLLSSTYADETTQRGRSSPWGPPLAFVWRRFGWRASMSSDWLSAIASELGDFAPDSPVLEAGLYGGSPDRAKGAFAAVKDIAGRVRWI